ncbi:MAG TPA: YetF domain-containing protein [Kofleriaceae bacterium]|nr:YetF domain-containing protein [Kofleriaceae bacterium]
MSVEQLFGEGRDLSALQMSSRAFVLFFLMLVLVRVAGMRAFGRHSSFDTIIVITLGAVLSRVVVGVSPAIPTVAASIVFVVLHRLVAIVTATVPALERLFKGRQKVLYRGGILELAAMRRAGISHADLEEAVRTKANRLKLPDVLEIHLESSGDLSVVDDVIGEARRVRRATAA